MVRRSWHPGPLRPEKRRIAGLGPLLGPSQGTLSRPHGTYPLTPREGSYDGPRRLRSLRPVPDRTGPAERCAAATGHGT
jgi:hypothetical protein